ncbi:unnamed protein product, partial [Cyprideis torosa]
SASPAKPPGQILQIVPILLEDICDSSHRVGKPYFRCNDISFAECVIPKRETGTDRPTLPEYPVAHPYVECIGQSFDCISHISATIGLQDL